MLGEITFALVGLLFLFSAIRTFVSELYQSYFGVVPNNTLGGIAVGLFFASVFAPVVARVVGPRRAMTLGALLLGLATLLSAAVRNNVLDVVLSAAAVLSGMWWLALLHSSRVVGRPSPLPLALPLAIVVDFALRTGLRTVPLVDQPLSTALPIVAIAALVYLASGLASLPGERTWTAPGLRGAAGLLALAPLLIVSELSGTNAAQVAAAGGLGLGPEPARSTQIGALVVGIGLAIGAVVLWRPLPRRPIAAGALVFGALLLWVHVPVLSLVGGAALAAGTLMASAMLITTEQRPARSSALSALALAGGWVLFVAVAFVYHAFYLAEAIWIATAGVALAVLAAPAVAGPRLRLGSVLLVAAISIAIPVTALYPRLGDVPLEPAKAALRVMTYNVHQGFDAYDEPGLDALVDTIAREDPDVLILEEVVRGWIIDEQHDVLGVISERLGMPYVFQPNIGDLYGNAILSRMPMTDVRRIAYAKEPNPRYQQRGALAVSIAGVLFIGTHLDEHADASVIRQEQVRTLLRAWDGATPAVVAGDLNALPDAVELELLARSGFTDLVLAAGVKDDTFSSTEPHERIDYIWGIGVTPSQAHVVNSTASDHRAVVVTITRSR